MIQKLLAHGLAWEKVDDFTPEKIDQLVQKDRRGYILEVNVGVSKRAAQKHNELPFLADRKLERWKR